VYRLYVQQGLAEKYVGQVVETAVARRIPLTYLNKQKLGQLVNDGSHQGVALEVGPYVYSDIQAMLSLAAAQQEPPLLLLLDLLHGPHNIGSLLRTAEICGVHGVILQDRRAPDITPIVVQYSAGAAEHLLIAQETNLVQAIKQLQAADVWIAGLDLTGDSQPLGQIDLNMPLAIVVGHEGQGLRRLVGESCDFLIRLPMRGQVASLNAAVAGSIMLYQAWQARGFIGMKI
jgi:23S rRNA (guanosine2251-2'-O)-methyltransferase